MLIIVFTGCFDILSFKYCSVNSLDVRKTKLTNIYINLPPNKKTTLTNIRKRKNFPSHFEIVDINDSPRKKPSKRKGGL